ncbi:methionine aminopeptidase 1D, mitochondrial isoform X2 [Ptiloglossa arizonensis]|uniref:methionine aminopeptidase 1D, mitochondrial isoform X2 n=1 Tax=Ptiloglossa arizonensis TaxID=3350558 RepID=UPI003F9F5DE4
MTDVNGDLWKLTRFIAKISIQKIVNLCRNYEIVEPWTVSRLRKVPACISKPSYSQSSIPEENPKEPEIKNKNQIKCMRDSCYFAKQVLNYIKQFVKPGITTDELDALAHEMIISNGAYPSPLNYQGFPKSICTSVNNVACHGIPDNRPLQKGDTLNIDVTVYLNGYHGDCSDMFEVEECDSNVRQLINVTKLCLKSAINICKPNENLCNIGNIIEETANKNGYSVIPIFLGHGIGTYFHGPPNILHFANDLTGKMLPGMTFTIEPILSQGSTEIEILEDGWTAVTIDNSCTAQVEHTILITDTGCDILTL